MAAYKKRRRQESTPFSAARAMTPNVHFAAIPDVVVDTE
jgi:hypothetical protein